MANRLVKGTMGEAAKATDMDDEVFDVELEVDQDRNAQANKAELAALKRKVAELTNTGAAYLELAQAVVRAMEIYGGAVEVKDVASQLNSEGYRVKLRSSLGAKNKDRYLTALRHDIIVAYVLCNGQELEAFIDISFRESFSISRPTDKYAALLDMVPEVFVGTKTQLVRLVALLAEEADNSFKAAELNVPPWRKTKTVLTKWFPVNMDERELSESAESDSFLAWSPDTVLPVGPALRIVGKELPKQGASVVQKVAEVQTPTVGAFKTVYGFSVGQTAAAC